MSAARRPLDGFAAGIMLLLCATWGLQQVAIKWAAPDLPPVVQVAVRNGLSAALVWLYATLRGQRPALGGRTLRAGALAGLLFAGEFLFIGEGLRHTLASHMSVFLYTAPAFTALGLHLRLPSERLRRHQWLGIALCFGGIALAFLGGSGGGPLTARALWGDLCGILAGAAWGLTTVLIRTSALSEAPPAVTLLYQLAGGFALLLPVALWGSAGGRLALTPVSAASLLFQGVVVSFASYLTWFWLLRRYLATRLAAFSFLTPIFGVAFGALLLGDPLTPAFLGGAALVMAGVVVVSGAGLLRRAA